MYLQVINDCRNESLNLYNQFGIAMKNVFDIQVSLSGSIVIEKKSYNVSLIVSCVVVAYYKLSFTYVN